MAAGVTEVFGNLAATTLNNGGTLSSGATSCTVTSGAAPFPQTGNFRILIDSEIMIVTANASNVFTITRGAEGTSAASHTDGSAVTHILTKGALQAVQQTRPVFTNTASGTYTMDSTGNPFDVLIIHNKSGAVSYVMPTPTAGRHIEVFDITGAIQTLANNVFFVPSANEKFNATAAFALTGTNYNFTNNNATVTATGSKFQSELAVGMSIQSSNQSGHNYIVSAIASDTSLTIATNFTGTTTTTATATRTSLTFAANQGKLFFDSDGTDWYATGDGTPTILKYTASSGGTVAPFIPPQGVTTAQFRGCGGGGGGAGGSSAVSKIGGAGGGGAIQSYEEVSITPLTSYAVTIGAGGANGAATANGSAGTDTTVGSLVTFTGASGGSASAIAANDALGGLCTKAGDGTNLYGGVDTTTQLATATSFVMSLASGGGAATAAAGTAGARNLVGGFAGGTGGSVVSTGGGGGGGGAGPRGAGGNGGNGANGVGAVGGSPAANTGAGGGGGGSSVTTTAGAGGTGGSGYVDIIYVL